MGNYHIPDHYTLREVYLFWLIAIDNKAFAKENGLNADQLTAFRNINHFTWGDFKKERSKVT